MKKVKSKDGTSIAFSLSGRGEPLIMIDGAFCRRTFGPMEKIAPYLVNDATVICYDRRGRGDSGDSTTYSVEREIEDIDALIREVGGQVNVFGMSSGGALAIKAVKYGLNIQKIAVYEPPFVTDGNEHKPPIDTIDKVKAILSQGDKSGAAKFYLTKVMGMPSFFYYIMRLLPMWTNMKEMATTLPYDAEIMGDFSLPENEIKDISIPLTVIGGDKSPKVLRTAVKAIGEVNKRAEVIILKNQTHNVNAQVVAPVLAKFFGNQKLNEQK